MKQKDRSNSLILSRLIQDSGIKIPNKEDFQKSVEIITSALQKTELGKRNSWDSIEVTNDVRATLSGVYTKYLHSLSGQSQLDKLLVKECYCSSEIERQILIFFIQRKEWGSRNKVLAYILSLRDDIVRDGLSKNEYEMYVYRLVDDVFSASYRWIVSWREICVCITALIVASSEEDQPVGYIHTV